MYNNYEMKIDHILAHRGIFSSVADPNSSDALTLALNSGFGIETDLRDNDGKVVVSHDPPRAGTKPLTLEWLLENVALSSTTSRIALNIKSDGLSSMVESAIKQTNIPMSRFFVFDMSIPDSLSYLNGTIPVYSRISDYEQIPAFKDKAKGIWIDNLDGTYPQVKIAKDLISEGFRVTIVSPELHDRDHKIVWAEILDCKIYRSPLFELCTDFPREAQKQFCLD
ncbi:hypothetical protein SynPROS71_00085 [Synechococcus sp. PROS-7-1]|nr:hypothetical protein SynPROS71_00085 [Synechococcus sp. PROS-7-1]